MGIGEKFAIGLALVAVLAWWLKDKDDPTIFW
jgi:hypothetical protein